jgi:hypothetical protein
MKAENKRVKVPAINYEEWVVLSLSKEEAQFLYDLSYVIGGDPDKSRRKYADALAKCLNGLGYTYEGEVIDA